MATAAQKAQQQRLAAAARQARREGKKGKALGKRVGELLRDRASHGAGHKTKHGTSHGGSHTSSARSHGGSVGGSHTKSKPKPRIALYAGAIASAGVVAGETLAANNAGYYNVRTNPGKRIPYALSNVTNAVTTTKGAAAALIPAGAGALISVAADKLGVNKRLAQMRWPFRL